jgi:mannose-6-phosphate isomerase
MGTHPNSPSHLAESDTPLKAHLAAHPALLGSAVAARFRAHDGDVPFLFKVLSIRKALSIQTHPDKPTAERLHAAQPHIYKGACVAYSSMPVFLTGAQMTTTSRRWRSR